MIRALVFDVGDTLLPVWKICRKSLRQMGKKYPRALLSEYYKEARKDTPFSWNAHGDTETMRRAIKNSGYSYDAKKLCTELRKIYWDTVRHFYRKEGAPEIAAIQEAQKTFKIGILSNNSLLGGSMFLKTAPFRVDASAFSENIKAEKPRKRAFETITRRLGIPAKETVYFGNDLQRDAPASRYGMNFVYVYGFLKSPGTFNGRKIAKITPRTLKNSVRYFEERNTQTTRTHNA